MDFVAEMVVGNAKEAEYQRMGPCEKLFCSYKSCPEALCDIACSPLFDCLCNALCGALCGTTNSKPVLSTVPPTAEGAAGAAVVAAAAATGDAK